MRNLCFLLLVVFNAGCHTTAGMLSGASEDLSRAGEWIKEKTDPYD